MKAQIQQLLEQTVSSLKAAALIPVELEPRIQVDNTKDKAHGDLATNLAMLLAKPAGKNPRELAQLIIDHLPASALVAKAEIAGPGFINFFLDTNWLAKQIEAIAVSPTAGVKAAIPAQTIVLDYSAPNVAKEMAVHHIRSTVIGDAVARTLEFLGHNIVRANHIGDWGTQFGMLIAYLEKVQNEQASELELSDLEAFYREAKKHYDEDEVFAERARGYVVKLQGGDEYCRTMWKKLVDITMAQNQRIYDRLNVSLTEKDVMGESLYNPMLKAIVEDLKAQGLAVEDDGAMVVYLDEFKGKDGDAMGVIVQKKDGGFLYTTTDIACAKYRVETLNADRVLYFIDSRQHQHLQQAWTIARKAGYVPADVSLEHHAFGMMLGKDGKPFKTREGGVMRLENLIADIDEEMFHKIVENRSVKDQDAKETAEIVGLSAIKYGDLSNQATKDYVFDIDRFTSFEGNTGPYILYTIVRIKSILNRYKEEGGNLEAGEILPAVNASQKNLMLELTKFGSTIENAFEEKAPHKICAYIYEVSNAFNSFYHETKILSEENQAQKESFLKLLGLTKDILETSIDLLGFSAPDRM